MKKNLKYVKIEGTLKSRGEYLISPAEYRPYEAVTLVDNDGDEIHFHTLSISKRMDESLNFEHPMTFYILRYRHKEKMVGVLYAVESNGDKVYYPDTAIPALKALGLQVRNRYQYIVNPGAAMGALLVCGGGLSLAFSLVLGLSFVPAVILGFGGMGFFIFSPLFFKEKGAGISEMLGILNSAGFNTTSNTNSKY